MGKNIGTRVNLTLPDSVMGTLDRYSSLTGKPRAQIIRHWLIEAMPVWEEVVKGLEAYKNDEAEGLKMLAKVLGQTGTTAIQMELNIKNTRRRMKRKNATSQN